MRPAFPLLLMLAPLRVAAAVPDQLPTTRAGLDAAVVTRFQMADTNRDGQIDRREAGTALGLAANTLARRPSGGVLFDLQTGDDGRPQISLREDGPLGPGGMIEMVWVSIDRNRDDRLSLPEVQSAARERFDAADRDRDGMLNGEELRRAQAQLGMLQRTLEGAR
ncbi:MAG: hypothetical protein JWR77_1795 [Rhizorhabdus sp.]|nr:hypothetical protein [Rhizorhabdus sp.]